MLVGLVSGALVIAFHRTTLWRVFAPARRYYPRRLGSCVLVGMGVLFAALLLTLLRPSQL
jgi:hypothetical protein